MMELLSQFHFLRPQMLLLLIPAVAIAWWLRSARRREGDWTQAVAPELLMHLISGPAGRRSRGTLLALLAAWCLGSFAAAGPSWEQLPRPVLQKQDALIVIMDLSYSMLSTDLSPSRADRVRRKLLDLLRQRQEGLSAMIAYAGDAHVVAPLTDDTRTIGNLLPALDPTMMPLPGSNPVDAIAQALGLFDSSAVRSGRLLLVTDGISEQDIDTIASLLENSAHRLAILGVGTEVGAPIPLSAGGFLKDSNGDIVVPALEEAPLQRLARGVDGSYQRLRVDDSDIGQLLADTASVFDEESISLDREADDWQDMAHWFVLPLLGVCLLSFRRGWVYGLAFVALIPAQQADAGVWESLWLRQDQQGARALKEGDAQRAVELFRDDSWRGTAAWLSEDYEGAAEAFSTGDDADSWYNRGNALAAQGRLDEALAAYRKTLDLQPDADDAQANIDALEKLKEQQQQQQQQQQQSQDQQGQQGQDQQQQSEQEQNSPSQQEGGSDSEGQQGQEPQPSRNSDTDGGDEQQQQDGSDSEEPQTEEDPAQQSGEGEERPAPLSPEIDNSAMQDALERDQAVEQWLRRVPDDPSGLLREKFRFESRQRQQQGDTRESSKIW